MPLPMTDETAVYNTVKLCIPSFCRPARSISFSPSVVAPFPLLQSPQFKKNSLILKLLEKIKDIATLRSTKPGLYTNLQT